MNYRIEDDWVIDENNNRASISYWGEETKAKASLQTLTYCTDCTDCLGCTNCMGCTGCTSCTNCMSCTDCLGCLGCKSCTSCTSCRNRSDFFKSNPFEAPKVKNIHQRVWEAVQVEDSFDMETWHKGEETPKHPCGTTHCWAGHIVAQAGAEGKALEDITSTEFAAKQIAKASSLPVNPVHFYDMDNARSLKRIEEMAKREKENEQ